jgi:hypothetical protein
MGGVALLLLIVCANIGGLLLARTRRGEIVIRLAVGATGSHLAALRVNAVAALREE